jgi:hypothetical protein
VAEPTEGEAQPEATRQVDVEDAIDEEDTAETEEEEPK